MRLARAALLLALASCAGKAPQPLALVNGEPVTAADLEREAKFSPAGARPAALLEELIDQALILQEASRLGLRLSAEELENQLRLARAGTPQEEFEAALEQRGLSLGQWRERIRRRALGDEVVRRRVRARIEIRRQDLKDYYWERVDRFRRPLSVKLWQVFSARRAQAEKALRELQLGEPFAGVAARYSTGPEAAQGGDLGWIEAGSLPKALESAAFRLKPGQLSPLVASAYGWHVFYAEARREPGAMTLEEAAPEIHAALLREREQPLYREWLFELRGRAEIRRFLKEGP